MVSVFVVYITVYINVMHTCDCNREWLVKDLNIACLPSNISMACEFFVLLWKEITVSSVSFMSWSKNSQIRGWL